MDKYEKDRQLLRAENVIGVLSIIVLLYPIVFAGLFPMEEWQRVVISFSGFIPSIAGFCYALRLEQIAGCYECECCNHKHVPKYIDILFAPHVFRTRYMKCPKCGRKSWQKKMVVCSKD